MTIWKQIALGFVLVTNACDSPKITPAQLLTPTTSETNKAAFSNPDRATQKANLAHKESRKPLYQWAQEIGLTIGDAYFCPKLSIKADTLRGHVASLGDDLDNTIETRAFESSLNLGIASGSPGLSCVLLEKHLNSAERSTNNVQRLILEASQRDRGLAEKP